MLTSGSEEGGRWEVGQSRTTGILNVILHTCIVLNDVNLAPNNLILSQITVFIKHNNVQYNLHLSLQ